MEKRKISEEAAVLIKSAFNNGWRHIRSTANAEVFQKGQGDARRQLTIPVYDDLPDYEWAINEARKTIDAKEDLASSVAEKRPKLAVQKSMTPSEAVRVLEALQDVLTGLSDRTYGTEMFFREPDGRWFCRMDSTYCDTEDVAEKALSMLDGFLD